jgi:hypothetical protein
MGGLQISTTTSDSRDARTGRCRRLIAECRAKVDGLTPELKQAVLDEIEFCERLIDLLQSVPVGPIAGET